MSDEPIRAHKLTEALDQPGNPAPDAGAAPGASSQIDAEQERLAEESSRANNAQGGVRDRLVDIGKAHHMGGRGTGRVSDT